MYQHNQNKSSVINLHSFVSNHVLWSGANRYLTGVHGEEGKRGHHFEVCIGLKYLSSTEDWRLEWWRWCYRSRRTHQIAPHVCSRLIFCALILVSETASEAQRRRSGWTRELKDVCDSLWMRVRVHTDTSGILMEDAGSESESLLGADDTALVPEEMCVCRLEGDEEERKCLKKNPPRGGFLVWVCWWKFVGGNDVVVLQLRSCVLPFNKKSRTRRGSELLLYAIFQVSG